MLYTKCKTKQFLFSMIELPACVEIIYGMNTTTGATKKITLCFRVFYGKDSIQSNKNICHNMHDIERQLWIAKSNKNVDNMLGACSSSILMS